MKNKNKFWQIKNEASSDRADILFYGDIASEDIWGDEITPKAFDADLKALAGKPLNLRINSGGGDIFAANAIYTMLKNYKGDVTAYIEGLCASAATVVACGADNVIMPLNALYMVHNPSIYLSGPYNADELDKRANALKKAKEAILSVYLEQGVSEEIASGMMNDETWLTAKEALDAGFVDEIVEGYEVDNYILGNNLYMNNTAFDLSRYKKFKGVNIKKERESVANNVDNHADNNDLFAKIKNLLGLDNAESTENKAAMAERERLEELEALKSDNPIANAIIEVAKNNGSTAENIQCYLDGVKDIKPVNSESEKALDAIKSLIADHLTSGGEKVKPEGTKANTEEIKNAGIASVVAYANKGRE